MSGAATRRDAFLRGSCSRNSGVRAPVLMRVLVAFIVIAAGAVSGGKVARASVATLAMPTLSFSKPGHITRYTIRGTRLWSGSRCLTVLVTYLPIEKVTASVSPNRTACYNSVSTGKARNG